MSAIEMHGSGRKPGRTQGVLLVSLGLLSTMVITLVTPAMLPTQQYFASFPHSAEMVAFAATGPALCMAILSPFVGTVVDRWGRKTPLVVSLILYLLMATVPLYVTSLPWFVASRLGLGVAQAILMTASMTMLEDFFDGEQRESYLELNTAVTSLSAIVIFAVGGQLGAISWRAPYALYLVAVLLLLAVVKWTWEPEHENAAEATEKVKDTASFSWLPVLAVCVVIFVGGLGFIMPQLFIATISAAHGYDSPSIAGNIAAIGSIAVPVGAYCFKVLRGKGISVPSLVALAFVLFGIGLLMMAYNTHGVEGIAAGMLVQEFGCGFMLSGLMIWITSLLPYEQRGKGTGAYFTSFFLAQPLCSVIFGLIQDQTGDALQSTAVFAYGAFIFALILIVVGIPLKLFERSHPDKNVPHAAA